MASKIPVGLLFLLGAVAMVCQGQSLTGTHFVGLPRCPEHFESYDSRRTPEERCHDGIRLQLRMLVRPSYGVVS